MPTPESTCWTLIAAAAAGNAPDREQFARLYAPVVRAYLAARWRQHPLLGDLDDAVQEVFVECFRSGGVLHRVDADRPGGLRPFLFGAVRNVALRLEESRRRCREVPVPDDLDPPADEESLSGLFDRAWVAALLRQAAEMQAATAANEGARRRVELLRLRFGEGLPIRDIAQRWQVDPARVHHDYARAREEFRAALLRVVAFHWPGSPGEVERRCAELLDHFS